MLLIIVFFVLLTTLIFWRQADKKAGEIKTKKKVVPEISVAEKKAHFKATIVPAVNKVYTELMQQYQDVSDLIQTEKRNEALVALRKQYKVSTNEELLTALKPHPQSIALAQAAIESSWGTSRFFKEANNTFGVWSFSKNDLRIAAGEKRGEKTIWIKKYASVADSVRDYYRTLARGSAYAEFRTLKMETNDPYELVTKLNRYSEKGAEYGKELAAIIRFNNFEAYDQQHIEL